MSKISEKRLNTIQINWGIEEDILINEQKFNLLRVISIK